MWIKPFGMMVGTIPGTYYLIVIRIEHKFSEFTIVTLWAFQVPLPLLLSMVQLTLSIPLGTPWYRAGGGYWGIPLTGALVSLIYLLNVITDYQCCRRRTLAASNWKLARS